MPIEAGSQSRVRSLGEVAPQATAGQTVPSPDFQTDP